MLQGGGHGEGNDEMRRHVPLESFEVSTPRLRFEACHRHESNSGAHAVCAAAQNTQIQDAQRKSNAGKEGRRTAILNVVHPPEWPPPLPYKCHWTLHSVRLQRSLPHTQYWSVGRVSSS